MSHLVVKEYYGGGDGVAEEAIVSVNEMNRTMEWEFPSDGNVCVCV